MEAALPAIAAKGLSDFAIIHQGQRTLKELEFLEEPTPAGHLRHISDRSPGESGTVTTP